MWYIIAIDGELCRYNVYWPKDVKWFDMDIARPFYFSKINNDLVENIKIKLFQNSKFFGVFLILDAWKRKTNIKLGHIHQNPSKLWRFLESWITPRYLCDSGFVFWKLFGMYSQFSIIVHGTSQYFVWFQSFFKSLIDVSFYCLSFIPFGKKGKEMGRKVDIFNAIDSK